MSQKQVMYASLLTVLLVLFPAFFQLSGMIILIQLPIAIAIGLILKPKITLIPTISNLIIFMIVQYPLFAFSQGSLANIFQSAVFGFNVSYIFAAEAMAIYLSKRKPPRKFTTYLKVLVIGIATSVLIGMTYYLIIM